MAPTPLTLAETASVFGEMLTFKKLLAETTDKKQRKAMLAAKVEDMINTVVRQIAFYTLRAQASTPSAATANSPPSSSARSGWRCSAKASAPRSS